jgi:crotonobetainyl-CoA:carnitine CoA-transferase CaiB-like acyl-CoA transferase
MQVRARHANGGSLPMVANPIRYVENPIQRYAPPPAIGEHTDAVLAEHLGLSPQVIGSLHAKGVI